MVAVPGAGSFPPESAWLNYLINGGWDIAQRLVDPSIANDIADADFGADRWKTFTENAGVDYSREDGTGVSEISSAFFGQFSKSTANGKILVGQALEHVNTVPLRGKTVRFQVFLRAQAALTFRMAVLELAAAGAPDTIPDDWVTTWEIAGDDPIFNTNIAIVGAAESKSVTTTFLPFSIDVTVPADSENLMVAIWSDALLLFGTPQFLEVAECGLFVEDIPRIWTPRLPETELALCQRYFIADNLTSANTNIAAGFCASTTLAYVMLHYPVQMRVAPTFSFSNVADFQVLHEATATDTTGLVAALVETKHATLQGTVASGLTEGFGIFLRSDGTANRFIHQDAEL